MDNDNNNNIDLTPSPTEQTTPDPKPVHEPTRITLPIQPIKEPSKAPWIIAIVLLLLIIAGGLAYYFLVLNKSSTEQASAMPSPTPAAQKPVASAAETLVEKAKDVFTLKAVATTQNQFGNGEAADKTVAYMLPSYQVGEYPYSVSAYKGYGTAVSVETADRDSINKDFSAVAKFLVTEGLKQKDIYDQDDEFQAYALYANDKVACTLSKAFDLRGQNYSGLGCTDMEDFEKASVAAKPFHDAFLVAKPEAKDDDSDMFTYYPAEIFDGANGYKSAEVGMATSVGLFYQAPSETKWTFLLGAQDTPPCTNFNTTALKNAFSGRPCYDPNASDLVKVKAP